MDEPIVSRAPPDPSALTTAQLLREVNSLEKLFSQRMDGIERAVAVAHENLVRVPTDVQKSVGHLDEVTRERFNVHLEKFNSVDRQFTERDVRTEQTLRDSKVAVDAALKAAKEAVEEQNKSSAQAIAKSDAATTKQIDQLGTLIQSTIGGINSQISDLKERLTRFEGQDRGKMDETASNRSASAATVGVIGVIAGALIGLGGLAISFMGRQQTSAAAGVPPAIVYLQPAPNGAAATPPPAQGSK